MDCTVTGFIANLDSKEGRIRRSLVSITVYVLTSASSMNGYAAMHGVYPSPEAAKKFAADHVAGEQKWHEHQQGDEPVVHFMMTNRGQWEIRQWELDTDGSPAFEAAVLQMARAIVKRYVPLNTKNAQAVLEVLGHTLETGGRIEGKDGS
jgi:hypothetical protein